MVADAYKDYEKEEIFLENTLRISAKELEQSNYNLYKKQELLNSVKNSMDDVVFYKDLDHTYIGCNAKFVEFLGLSEEDLIGKSDFDLFDAITAKKYHDTNEEIMQKRIKVTYKHWVKFKENKAYVLTSKTPLLDRYGKIIGIVGISRDITHEFELQKEVEHKNIMLFNKQSLYQWGK